MIDPWTNAAFTLILVAVALLSYWVGLHVRPDTTRPAGSAQEENR